MLLENPPPPHNFSNGPSLKESKSSRGGGEVGKNVIFIYEDPCVYLPKWLRYAPEGNS